MNYNEPSKDVIDRVKASHPDRSLRLVEAIDGEDTYFFIMTGAAREEYKKFTDEMLSGKDAKDDKQQIENIRGAIERAALAQIRHPDREECKRIFNFKPAMIQNFAEEIQRAAGANVEVRSKNL